MEVEAMANEHPSDDAQRAIRRFKQDEEVSDYKLGRSRGTVEGQRWAEDAATFEQMRHVSEEGCAENVLHELIESWHGSVHIPGEEEASDGEDFTRGYFDGFREGGKAMWEEIRDCV